MKHAQSGSILLEILLTLGGLLIVILGLVLAILAGTQLQLRGQRQALASQLANQQFEILRGRPVASLGSQTDGPLIGNPEPALTNLPAGQAQLTIGDYQNDPNLKEVTLEISFAEGNRAVHLTFATLLGAGGLNE
ncbi:MAG: hypothetical protein AAB647_02670 [Patescibacteria group bacterium]